MIFTNWIASERHQGFTVPKVSGLLQETKAVQSWARLIAGCHRTGIFPFYKASTWLMTHKERHMLTRDVHNFEHTHCLFLPILKIIVIAVHCTMYTVHCTLCTEHYRVGVYGADSCIRNMKLARGKSSPWNRKLWPAHNLNSTSVLAGDQNSFLLPNR